MLYANVKKLGCKETEFQRKTYRFVPLSVLHTSKFFICLFFFHFIFHCFQFFFLIAPSSSPLLRSRTMFAPSSFLPFLPRGSILVAPSSPLLLYPHCFFLLLSRCSFLLDAPSSSSSLMVQSTVPLIQDM